MACLDSIRLEKQLTLDRINFYVSHLKNDEMFPKIWDELKKRPTAHTFLPLMNKIDEIVANKDEKLTSLEPSEVKIQAFFTEMCLLLLESEQFSESEKKAVQHILKYPPTNKEIKTFEQKFSIELRTEAFVRNILSVVKNLPNNAEIVLQVGFSHVKGIVLGLEENLTS